MILRRIYQHPVKIKYGPLNFFTGQGKKLSLHGTPLSLMVLQSAKKCTLSGVSKTEELN
jgi:hypothetical protein